MTFWFISKNLREMAVRRASIFNALIQQTWIRAYIDEKCPSALEEGSTIGVSD